jgi:hypothetical protein
MDISHDHTNFETQIPFLGSGGPIFAFWTPKSVYFLYLYKISDRLMGHMTYFIFEPHSAQPRDPVELQSILRF